MAGRFASPISDEQESLLRQQGFRGAKLDIRVKSLVPLFYTSKIFNDQLIKERTGYRSLEALHKYKRTGADQQFQVSMAILPSVAKKNEKDFKAVPPCHGKENLELDEDFQPMPKKQKFKPDDVQALFPKSSMTNCTFNININK